MGGLYFNRTIKFSYISNALRYYNHLKPFIMKKSKLQLKKSVIAVLTNAEQFNVIGGAVAKNGIETKPTDDPCLSTQICTTPYTGCTVTSDCSNCGVTCPSAELVD